MGKGTYGPALVDGVTLTVAVDVSEAEPETEPGTPGWPALAVGWTGVGRVLLGEERVSG